MQYEPAPLLPPSSPSAHSTSSGASPSVAFLSNLTACRECDYDTSPTALYQAIEARRWDLVLRLLEDNDNDEASIWVVRKETNGRLRWRLLPIHAAIIFQAPNQVVEVLLTEYAVGAAAKDDQGMLPLHLAFRNQPINWWMVEDLLTAHPAAVFVKDRKGRTPLAGGLAAANAAACSQVGQQQHDRLLTTMLYQKAESIISIPGSLMMMNAGAGSNSNYNSHYNTNNNNNNNNNTGSRSSLLLPMSPSSAFQNPTKNKKEGSAAVHHVMEEHKVALTVLELYTSIVVAGEKTRWRQQQQQQHPGLATTGTTGDLTAAAGAVIGGEQQYHHPPQYWRQQMAALAERHAQRLTELRDDFAKEQKLRREMHEQEIQSLKELLERKKAKIVQEEDGAIEIVEAHTTTSGFLLCGSDIDEETESIVDGSACNNEDGDDTEVQPSEEKKDSPLPSPGNERQAVLNTDTQTKEVNKEGDAARDRQYQVLVGENQSLRRTVQRLLHEQQSLAESMEQRQLILDHEARRVLAQQQMWQHEQVRSLKDHCERTRDDVTRQLENLSAVMIDGHFPPTVSSSTTTTWSTAPDHQPVERDDNDEENEASKEHQKQAAENHHQEKTALEETEKRLRAVPQDEEKEKHIEIVQDKKTEDDQGHINAIFQEKTTKKTSEHAQEQLGGEHDQFGEQEMKTGGDSGADNAGMGAFTNGLESKKNPGAYTNHQNHVEAKASDPDDDDDKLEKVGEIRIRHDFSKTTTNDCQSADEEDQLIIGQENSGFGAVKAIIDDACGNGEERETGAPENVARGRDGEIRIRHDFSKTTTNNDSQSADEEDQLSGKENAGFVGAAVEAIEGACGNVEELAVESDGVAEGRETVSPKNDARVSVVEPGANITAEELAARILAWRELKQQQKH